MRRVSDGCKGMGWSVGRNFLSRAGAADSLKGNRHGGAGPRACLSARMPLSIMSASRRVILLVVIHAREICAACTQDVRHEQSFGAKEPARTMMSTHCSLLMSPGLSRTALMTSAFVSAFVFSLGIILGYALRAWRVLRSPANSSRGILHRPAGARPVSTFGHARRAF